MARTREVGTLWIGGKLSWMEQLCLKSFVDQGQKITLFSYEKIPNVPDGVICRDGREIIDTDDFIKYEKKDSFALFADLFRLHMIKTIPGMIWVDTDVYCYRPMDYESDYVMGFELPGEHRVNNAVLGLPADSPMLSVMLDFTSDRFSIAPFLPAKMRKKMHEDKKAGNPVHVSQQPWGVWGPMMVTHFTHTLNMQDKVQPIDAFYPINFRERKQFLKNASKAEKAITKNTTALHLWASNKRPIGNNHDGLPPKGSYFEKLVKKHNISPTQAPISGRGVAKFDAGLLDHVELETVERFADVSGNARSFALSLQHKYDCSIHLINMTSDGEFSSKDQGWVQPYKEFLIQNDVDPKKITIVHKSDDLRPVDIIANLNGFGDVHKVKHLNPIMENCLHSETKLFMDIKQGSGAFPYLRSKGANQQLNNTEIDGKKFVRVVFQPNPMLEQKEDKSWDDIATKLAGSNGFYHAGDAGHSFLYVPRSKDTLVVTFDNLDITMNNRKDRRPWGYNFIEAQGWSMLGVLAGGWTWYREPWVSMQFDKLKKDKFFKQFKKVVFYGASMGGYAACAFSSAAPGCDVVAISPQSTVDKSIVPWETRYKVVWDRDFSGKYGDAAKVSKGAKNISIFYDPYSKLDAAHADRFTGKNVTKYRAPLLGHRLGSSLNQMGILTPIILSALEGKLTEQEFYKLIRARRDFPRYQRELFNRAIDAGHTELAKKLGHFILSKNDNRAIRRAMKNMT